MGSENVDSQSLYHKPEDAINKLLQSPNPFDPAVIKSISQDTPFLVSKTHSDEMKSQFRSLNYRIGKARKNSETPDLETLTQQKNHVVQKALWQELPYILKTTDKYRHLGVEDHDVLQYAMLASTEAVTLWVYSKDDISLRQAIKTKIEGNLSQEVADENNIKSEDLPLLKVYIDVLNQNPDKDDVHLDVLEDVATTLPDYYPEPPHIKDYDMDYRKYIKDKETRSQTEQTLKVIQSEYRDHQTEPTVTDEEFKVDQINLSNALQTALEKLSPREREVIEKYYGLYGNVEMTQEDIGKSLDVTRERVRQIRDKALRKLRHPARGLRSYANRPTENFSKLEIRQLYEDALKQNELKKSAIEIQQSPTDTQLETDHETTKSGPLSETESKPRKNEQTKSEPPKTTETKTQPLKDWESRDFWRYINTTCRERRSILPLEDTPESINPNNDFHTFFDDARRQAIQNDRRFSVVYLDGNGLKSKVSLFSDEFRNPTPHTIGTFHHNVPDVNLRIFGKRIFRDKLFDNSPSIGTARLADLSMGNETLFVGNADQKYNYLALKTSSTKPAENWHPFRLKNFEDTEENTTTMLAADLDIALYRGKPGEPLLRIYPPVPDQQDSSNN